MPVLVSKRLLATCLTLHLILLPAEQSLALPTDQSSLAVDRGFSASVSSASVVADPFSGAATYSVPIDVPPGTAGMAPELQLQYSSAGPRDSWVGSRWTLSVPTIQRSLKRGTPSYDDGEDVFTYGGQELVLVSGTDPKTLPAEYRTRRNSFDRIVHESDDTWTVSRKDGTRLSFGLSANARIEAPLATFAWMVARVVDTNSNAYSISYDRTDPGSAYPMEIRYTLRENPGTGALSSLDGDPNKDRLVSFVLENRPDSSESFLAGFPRVLSKRLARIDLAAQGSLVRRYELEYVESADTFRSLLTAIELHGVDADAPNPSTPIATTFSYHSNVLEGTTGWQEEPWSWSSDFPLINGSDEDEGVRIVDVDGDALPDLVKSFANFNACNPNSSGCDAQALTPLSGVYLNTGSGWSTTASGPPWVLPEVTVNGKIERALGPFFAMKIADHRWGSGKIPIDLDGDGRVDILQSSIFLNPSGDGGDDGITMLDDDDRKEQPHPVVDLEYSAPWFGSSSSGWMEVGPQPYPSDNGGSPLLWASHPGTREASLAFLAFAKERPIVVGGMSQFADLNGDGLPEWIVRGTRSIEKASGSGCAGGAYTSQRAPVGTAAASHVLRNLGGFQFELPALTVESLDIPASPGGQTPSCIAAPYLTHPDWQLCDAKTDPTCAERLFHSRTYMKKGSIDGFAGNYFIVTRHHELGNRWVDLNSDGLADQITSYLLSGGPVAGAYVNDGQRGFAEDADWELPYELYKIGNSDEFSTDKGARFADVNGDGRVDLVVARSQSGGGNLRETYLNDGDASPGAGDPGPWVPAPEWALPVNFQKSSGKDRGVRLIDVDGDGMLDLVEGRSSELAVRFNRGSVPDLLTDVENPLGGTTHLEYRPSSEFVHLGSDGVPDLPQVMQLVGQLTVDDANGVVATTTFEYADGFFDAEDREFRGFGEVTVTSDDGRVTKTHYLQSVEETGLPWLKAVTDATGATIETATYAYTQDADGLPPYDVLPESIVTSDPYPRLVRTTFEYDEGGPILYGNRTATIEWGEVNLLLTDLDPSDNRVTERSYVINDGAIDTWDYLVDRVASARRREGATPGSGNVVTETLFFYDEDEGGSAPPPKGNLTKQVEVLNDSVLPDPTTRFGYDEFGNRTSTTAPRTNAGEASGSTTIEYDGVYHAFVAAIEDPDGNRREFSYAPPPECDGITSGAIGSPAGAGLVQVEQGPNELANTPPARWLRCYDAFGRMVYESSPNGARLRRAYQDDPSIGVSRQDLRLVDGSGNEAVTTTFIDGLGRAHRVESDGPQGETIVVDTTYDAMGRIARQSVPYFLAAGPGSEFIFEHDELDRLTTRKLDTRVLETLSYDAGLVLSTDGNSNKRERLVDAFGRVRQVTEFSADGNTLTTYEYDARDLLTNVIDDVGNETEIQYDALGRTISIDDPDSGVTEFRYGSNGNVTRREDARGHVVTWLYDDLDRPTTQKIDDTTDVTWAYDTAENGIGLLRSRTDRLGTYKVVAYDFLGRPTYERWRVGGFDHDRATQYTEAGEIEFRVFPSNVRIDWVRDAKGFVTEVSSATRDYATGVVWDASGRLTDWTSEGGVLSTFEYDATRLQELQVQGAAVLEHLDFEYDGGDRVSAVVDLRDSSLTRTFSYDNHDRLKLATGPFGPNQASASLFYRYDSIGNLTCKGAGSSPGTTATSCANAGGKALEYPTPGPGVARPHAPFQVAGQSTSFDASGNLGSLGTRSYTHNGLGQLSEARESGALQASFVYDGEGRLARMDDHSGASVQERFFLYPHFEWDRTASTGRIHVELAGLRIATQEGDYTPTQAGPGCGSLLPALPGSEGGGPGPAGLLLAHVVTTWLLWYLLWTIWRRPAGTRARAALATGLGGAVFLATSLPTPLSFGGARRARAAAPFVIYYHTDLLGSSVLVTDSAGALVQRSSYTPFGEAAPAASGGPSPVPEFGFTGQRFVSGLGIYDYGARWYDPALGRFLQADTIVPEPFDPQSLNRYSYVRNSPTNRIDPTGNFDLFGGITNFFTSSLPTFFTQTVPDFFAGVPSFVSHQIFDPFYENLVSPVVSGVGALFGGSARAPQSNSATGTGQPSEGSPRAMTPTEQGYLEYITGESFAGVNVDQGFIGERWAAGQVRSDREINVYSGYSALPLNQRLASLSHEAAHVLDRRTGDLNNFQGAWAWLRHGTGLYRIPDGFRGRYSELSFEQRGVVLENAARLDLGMGLRHHYGEDVVNTYTASDIRLWYADFLLGR